METGTHAELVARGGKYADLWARQANVDDLADIVSAASAQAGARGSSSSVSGEGLGDGAPQGSSAGTSAQHGTERLERQLEGDGHKQGSG